MVSPFDPKNTITLVSGMPRSGTSMMMQMLEAAELPIASDRKRAPDESNPKGYFELDAAKRLPEDSDFLRECIGSAVKIVSPLLPHLPHQFQYRIIFMERDLGEVLASQRAMLGQETSDSMSKEDAALKAAFNRAEERVKSWIDARDNIVACFISHREAIEFPERVAGIVADFLETEGEPIDRDARERMASVVDAHLYRKRAQQ